MAVLGKGCRDSWRPAATALTVVKSCIKGHIDQLHLCQHILNVTKLVWNGDFDIQLLEIMRQRELKYATLSISVF